MIGDEEEIFQIEFLVLVLNGDRRGTGQIREGVKEDENGIGIADARSLSSEAGEGGGVAKQIGEDPGSRNFSAKQSVTGARQKKGTFVLPRFLAQ